MKIHAFLLSATALLLAACQSNSSDTAAQSAKSAFNYAHWNIGHFSSGTSMNSNIEPQDAQVRLAEYKAYLKPFELDWIGISEYSENFAKDGSVKASKTLFAPYQNQFIGAANEYQWNAQFGNGRFKTLERKLVDYNPRRQKCYFIAQKVEIDGKYDAWIIQTHLDWHNPEIYRDPQFRQLIDFAKDKPRVIISADFNNHPFGGFDEFHWFGYFQKEGFVLAFPDKSLLNETFRNRKNPQKHLFIDNIIVKGFDVSNAGILADEVAKFSDHYLMHCTLTPKK